MRARNDERRVEEYVRRLAIQNAALLQQKTGKFTPLEFLPDSASAETLSTTTGTSAGIEAAAAAAAAAEAGVPGASAAGQPVAEVPRRSVYVFGSVGRGKSMLADLLWRSELSSLASEGKAGRWHFSKLMREVHGELAKHQKTVEEIGAEYAAKYEYMVLDEVMVDSVQDAVVLPRLLTELLRRGVAMIMTSNRRPDELYEDGLNRHLYLPPLVESLRVGCRLVNVDYGGWGEVDYRTRGAAGRGRYVEVEEAWRTLWTEEAAGQTTESRAWKIPGSSTRSMKMEVIRTAVRMNVEELCYGEKYGEFDYVELAEWLVKEKKRLYVGKVKKLKKDEAANEGRMLGRLIETMYDAGVEMRVYGDKREEIFKKIIEEGGEVEIKGINSQQLVEAARRAQSRLSELQQ